MFNIAFTRVRAGGPVIIFKTACESAEDLQRVFDGRGEDDTVVDFLAFKGNVAKVLAALCEISFVESELMQMFQAVYQAKR